MTDGVAFGGYQPGPRTALRRIVAHAGGVCTTYEAPEPLEGLPVAARRVHGGGIVSCPACLQPGIEPDDGQLAAFLPSGALHDPVNRTVTWVYRV